MISRSISFGLQVLALSAFASALSACGDSGAPTPADPTTPDAGTPDSDAASGHDDDASNDVAPPKNDGGPADAAGDATDAASPAAPFALTARPHLLVRSGASSILRVTLTRSAGFSGSVTVSLEGLPNGAQAAARVLGSDIDTAAIVLGIDAGIGPGTRIDASIVASAAEGTVKQPLTVIVAGPPFTLDPTFPLTPFGVADLSFGVVALPQADGKIVVVSGKGEDKGIALMRHDISGAVDRSFGTTGTVTPAIPAVGKVLAGIFAPNDKILVASGSSGCFDASDTRCTVAVSRHRLSGELDTTFAQVGYAKAEFGKALTHGAFLLVDPNGRVSLAAIYADTDVAKYGVMKWDAAGAPVTGFGTSGFAAFTDAPNEKRSPWVHAAGLRADGSVELAISFFDSAAPLGQGNHAYGFAHVDGNSSAVSWKIQSIGTASIQDIINDGRGRFIAEQAQGAPSFGFRILQFSVDTDGYVNESAESMLLEPSGGLLSVDGEGRPIVIGTPRGASGLAAVRFTRDSKVDAAFGNAGVLPVAVSGGHFVSEPLGSMLAFLWDGASSYSWKRIWPF
jgi:hypothetical protein